MPDLSLSAIRFETTRLNTHDLLTDTYDLDMEVEMKLEEVFGAHAPIKFQCKKSNLLQVEIQKLIQANKIKIPIIHIKDSLYLVGPNRCNCELRKDSVMIRIGAVYKRFEDYVPQNEKQM